MGIPKTLNRGFQEAEGESLTWTSSDNLMEEGMLGVMVDYLDKNLDVGMCYADFYTIDESGNVQDKITFLDKFDAEKLLLRNYIGPCFMYRRKCWEEIGKYDENLVYAEDWDM